MEVIDGNHDATGKILEGWTAHIPRHAFDGSLLNNKKVYILETSPWAQAAINIGHGVGHEGIPKTLQRVRT